MWGIEIAFKCALALLSLSRFTGLERHEGEQLMAEFSVLGELSLYQSCCQTTRVTLQFCTL